MKNYQLGSQHTVTRNVVTFLPGDFVGSRLRSETLHGVVTAVQGMDYITIRHGQESKVETFDSDYFYIIKGVDETSSEQFQRMTIRYEELTR